MDNLGKKQINQKGKKSLSETFRSISKDRQRTNLLRKPEQAAIAFLVRKIPDWVSSDMLTSIGFLGGVLVFASFVLGHFFSRIFLLLGVLGFFIVWFGDSLDGRIAYYRHKPRKWYGFTLDLTTDWVSVILMGLGFIVYVQGVWQITGYLFVGLYGWEIITALLRYKVTGQYSIDSGIFGPTEVRLIISTILILEVFFQGTIVYFSGAACALLFVTNIIDYLKLLRMADQRDKQERERKAAENV